jgi:hypothetical protein
MNYCENNNNNNTGLVLGNGNHFRYSVTAMIIVKISDILNSGLNTGNTTQQKVFKRSTLSGKKLRYRVHR